MITAFLQSNGSKLLCAHCHLRIACKSRGLCGPCYDNRDIRNKYPVEFDAKNFGDFYGYGGETTPTNAPPGTPEKMMVLRRRATKKQQLFHPQDA